jgi:hypothetical protein
MKKSFELTIFFYLILSIQNCAQNFCHSFQEICSFVFTIETNNKWCAYELNSKFYKTYKIYLKVLSLFDIEKDSLFINLRMTYYFLISHVISFNETLFFNETRLLLMRKFAK